MDHALQESPVHRMQANMIAYFRLFAGLPGVTVVDGDVFWTVTESGAPGDQVLGAWLDGPDVEARIDAVLREIGRHTQLIEWMVFPGCRPADLGARLASRDMPSGPGGIWMYMALPTPPEGRATPDGFRAELVRSPAELDIWRHVSTEGFQADASAHAAAYLRHGFGANACSLHFIGYQGESPVTSATLLLAGGIAGLWDISTPPDMRGRGYGEAITRHMLREAHERGCADAWVWSSQMGRGVYERAGFVQGDFGVREYTWVAPSER
jgi:GNAT superfamily N-acetyltransferase